MKILGTADLHIGRRSSRLPTNIDSRGHSSGEAWTRIVDLAIAEKVDIVAVSGDMIDNANRYFEAIGTLERGLELLAKHDIETVVVAGNHDHDSLPVAISSIGSERIRLLGRGGRWERATFERRGRRLHIDGWSFPRESHITSAVMDYEPVHDGTLTLALLHADLDQPRSRYGPVALAELRGHPEVFFLLGHVHGTRRVNEPGGARLLYPGSPQALDPGEPGRHGVFILTVENEGFDARFVPLSTVQYETIELDVTGLGRPEEIDSMIHRMVSARLDEEVSLSSALRHLQCRIRLTGSTPLHRGLGAELVERVAELMIQRGDATASVEWIEVATRPNRDLTEIAKGQGPPAILARLLIDLDDDVWDEDVTRLLAEVTRATLEIEEAPPYQRVQERPRRSEDERKMEAINALRRAAGTLLDEVLIQKERQG